MWEIIFIVLAVLLVLIIIFFVSFPFIRRTYISKKYIEAYGRRIYKIALHNDYYLINRLLLSTMDGTKIDIEHLLCGNKYIYVINDQYIKGGLYARINDRTWIKSTKFKKEVIKEKIENLLLVNKRRMEVFSQITSVDTSFLINIVVINDNCDVEGYEEIAKNAFLINISSLNKLIMRLEKSDVKVIKDSQLKRAVLDIAKLNERKKNETKHS